MAIASHSVQCFRYFEQLAQEAQHLEDEPPLPASTVEDELGRFKIWAGNIGALQRDSRSLDYRLREASQVGDQVTKILQHLEISLRECIEIVSGQRPLKQVNVSDAEAFNDEFSDTSDSDKSEDSSSSASGQEPVSELSQLLLAVSEAITSLYKLSIAIRNPTPRDRYAKAASSTPIDVSYDIGHVYEKYPQIRSKAWLLEKLGRAITRRREFLRYREQHREKIGGKIRPSTGLDERHELAETRRRFTYVEAQSPVGGPVVGVEAHSISHSQLASTKATTYVANLNGETLGTQSIAGRSETSFVTSIADDDSHSVRQIPDPPKESVNGMPFECPYCFTILAIKNTTHWKKHVLTDLQPYLCTFEGCSTQMFQSRHQWFQHELDKHRKEWHCCLCSNEMPFSSAAWLEVHLNKKHSEYSGQQISALLSLCERPPESIPISACPFCAGDSSGSTGPPYIFTMAATNFSTDLWDPYSVLDVNPSDPRCTCVGMAYSTGRRCRWPINGENFSAYQRSSATETLKSMSNVPPSKITQEALFSLAQNTLCRDFHQTQADAISRKWKAEIADYFHSSLRVESSSWSDVPAGGSDWQSYAVDHDAHHGPALRAHSASSPTVMVSSLQFERHVASHLEQLALFALPPPMKESTGVSSKHAAASRNSNRTTRADAMSDVSSLSFALTDHGNPPDLYAAVMSGNIERVMLEIRNGADLNLYYGRFGSVLQAAAARLSWPSRDAILQILLDNGADPNMQCGVYGNALQAVAAKPGLSGRRVRALEILIQSGADVNAAGGRYGHALVAAAATPTSPSETFLESTPIILKLLIDCGANPDAQGSNVYGSALHQAIEHNDDESVQLLLDRGASTTVRYEHYGTPVDRAKTLAYEPVWQLIQRAAIKTNLERRYARIRLSAALRLQKNFRRRKTLGYSAWSSNSGWSRYMSNRKTLILETIKDITRETTASCTRIEAMQKLVDQEVLTSTRTALDRFTITLTKVRRKLEDDIYSDNKCRTLQIVLQVCKATIVQLKLFLEVSPESLDPAQDAQLGRMKSRIQDNISSLEKHARTSKAVFGLPLAEAVEYCRPIGADVCLPAVVYRCLEFLETNYAAITVDLFRIDGSQVEIQELKNRFNTERDMDLLIPNRSYDTHVIASLLKIYLTKLPDFSLTGKLGYENQCALGEQLGNTAGNERDEVVAEYKIIVHRLPKANYTLLHALFAFVVSIPESSHLSETDRRDVGIDLTSILHLPVSASEIFLMAFDGIFDRSFDEETHRSNNTGPRLPANPGLPNDVGRKPETDAADILSVIDYLRNLGEVVQGWLSGIGGATWEKILSVLSDINAVLTALRYSAAPDSRWSSTLQELNVPEGPIEELRAALEILEFGLVRHSGREDLIERILGILLRQKELFELAQQNDPDLLYQAIKGDGGEHNPPAKPVEVAQPTSLELDFVQQLNEAAWKTAASAASDKIQ